MFRNVVSILTGGISSTRIGIFSNIITSNGGIVLKRIKTASLFKKTKKITPLDETLTHLIIENRNITSMELCNLLDCLEIPNSVKIIHCSWIEECAKNKTFIEPSEYEIDLLKNEERKGDDNNSSELLSLKRDRSEEVDFQNISKCVRGSDIEVQEVSSHSFEDECLELGNGWHLLHNYIDEQRVPSLLFRFSQEVRICNSVIGFDMDGTIITTRSGATFAKDSNDWQFLYHDIPAQLRNRYQSGAHLFIVSNQNGVNKGHVTVSQLITKFDNIVTAIGLPMDIACAFANDVHRKPRTGAWEFLAKHRFVDYATDETTRLSILGQSMYVGDAAGRPKTKDRPKDFSASDYKMSLNLGVQFQTPEQFFRDSRTPLHCDRSGVDLGFSLRDYLRQNPPQEVDSTIFDVPESSMGQEIILLIGPPACGKSTIARKLEASGNCVRINQDTLKTRPACIKAARSYLSSGKSIIVDNTNSNRTQRADWVSLAQEFSGVVSSDLIDIAIIYFLQTVRCIRIDIPKELCFHMISYRLSNGDTLPEDRREIPGVAVHTFYKRMEEPSLSEGFTRVDRIPFVPQDPTNSASAKLLYSYL